MLSCGGFLILLFGLVLVWLSRSEEGLVRRIPLALGLILCAIGLWYALFESGEGLARLLPRIAR